MIGEIKMIIAVERKDRSMNGDLISRQDAIDAVDEYDFEFPDYDDTEQLFALLKEAIERLKELAKGEEG